MYVGYTLTQIPSNVFLHRLRKPSVYLSYCILLWGIISISIGFAQSYRAVLVSRFLLGFTEATYYPGVMFILSRWYKRDELGLRMAYFGFGVYFSAVLGPLIASGILATMDGILGYAAWRWLFFIEGGLTCLIAAAGVYMIPDFPSTPVSWLTHDEQILAQRRMAEDLCGLKQEGTPKSGLVEAFTDWTVWWLALARSMATVGESFENFLPTLAATIGYDPSVTLLLCAPPWVLSMVALYYVSQHSDATRDRFWHIVFVLCGGIMGFSLGILTMNPAVRYLSLLLATQSDVSYVIFFAWVSNSIPESSKRAVAMAFINTCSTGIANVGASYLWPASWGPSYSKSYMSCILTYTTCILMLWVYRSHLIRLNKKAEIDERALGLPKGFRFIT
ncbi:hypothetical protein SCLCIDRAFT_1225204 [Scleroderma citrinum Foug A]|uniref:Major facilitator superfamily (MFS) profile domain-containing protein n=1 Tax=Scleroderma citrinum Foug A TaxID=1036808 RepID=A0A0C3CQ27_9AGAM|nr:hypothetical protein SCLCIDRAFT_1225204 [Scleroderma citrinum Foug A]